MRHIADYDPRLAVIRPADEDIACIAGSVVFTRQEVQEAADLPEWIKAKADGMRTSFEKTITNEINARGWASIPTTEE